ncbi:hypothetical protein GCM10009527_098160 [Actinomadura nitritigenes]
MPYIECQSCRGSGTVSVPRTDKNGKTVYVSENCKACRGSGVIPMSESAQTYPCPWCDAGYLDQPTMMLVGGTMTSGTGRIVTGMAPRTCKACNGTGRTSCAPGTPPVP